MQYSYLCLITPTYLFIYQKYIIPSKSLLLQYAWTKLYVNKKICVCKSHDTLIIKKFWRYLNEMVLRALSATAWAFSISEDSRWWAMYLIQTRELSGDWSTIRSKSSVFSGRTDPSNCLFSNCNDWKIKWCQKFVKDRSYQLPVGSYKHGSGNICKFQCTFNLSNVNIFLKVIFLKCMS